MVYCTVNAMLILALPSHKPERSANQLEIFLCDIHQMVNELCVHVV